MGLGGEKWPVGTTEDTDLEPVNWNKVAWEPDGAGSPTNPGRQAPPAGPPGWSPPPRAPSAYSVPGSTGDPAPQPLGRTPPP